MTPPVKLMPSTLNTVRRGELLELMERSGWDLLLLYGHSWRKDFFRTLVNFSFFGPHAVAALDRAGELRIVLSHPWDHEYLVDAVDAECSAEIDFEDGLARLVAGRGKIGIAGMELMEACLVDAIHGSADEGGVNERPVSATLAVEELRRAKTPEEIEGVRQAVRLADRGYQHFTEVIEEGMAEYELVAEVEGFLKSHGAEDNFMLIGSGGTEVFGMKPPTERRFSRGDNVTTELSPQVNGYFAQICRTLVVGEPSPAPRRCAG